VFRNEFTCLLFRRDELKYTLYVYVYVCVCVCVYIYIHTHTHIHTGSAKKMYTQFNERKIYVVC